MNRKKYYELLEKYRKLVSQKQFNPYLVNQGELDDVKSLLIKKVKANCVMTAGNIVDEEHKCRKCGLGSKLHPVRTEKLDKLRAKHGTLVQLYEKINAEEAIQEADCEDTYCGLFGEKDVRLAVLGIAAIVCLLLASR